MRSKLFELGIEDFLKGFLMAVFAPVIVIIMESLQMGEFTFNWPLIATAAAAGGLGYLKMRFLSNDSGQLLRKDVKDYIGGRPNDRP